MDDVIFSQCHLGGWFINHLSFLKLAIYHIMEASEGRFLPLSLDECAFSAL